jgi:hypothetical protein
MLEKTKEDFDHPTVLEDQRDDIGVQIEPVGCDQQGFALFRSAPAGFGAFDMRRASDGHQMDRNRELLPGFSGAAQSNRAVEYNPGLSGIRG